MGAFFTLFYLILVPNFMRHLYPYLAEKETQDRSSNHTHFSHLSLFAYLILITVSVSMIINNPALTTLPYEACWSIPPTP